MNDYAYRHPWVVAGIGAILIAAVYVGVRVAQHASFSLATVIAISVVWFIVQGVVNSYRARSRK